MIITTGVLMAVTTIVLMAKADVIYDSLGIFMGKALDENGRIPLWKDAWKNFKANPIFGTGFDYYLGGHNGGNPTDIRRTGIIPRFPGACRNGHRRLFGVGKPGSFETSRVPYERQP